jgi:nitroreductase
MALSQGLPMPRYEQLHMPPFNQADGGMLDLLLTRRSGSAKAMTGPGPTPGQLADLLKCAARVPDHGKLFPWRFIIFEGDARARAGNILAEVTAAEGAHERQIEEERGRFLRAPLVVGVISTAREMIKIPLWEQELSAGAVCQTLLIAATAMGFAANWLTEWYAFHPVVRDRLGLKAGERVAGFIYVGHAALPLEERPRPDMEAIVTRY